jgi:HlyD family secretion protein
MRRWLVRLAVVLGIVLAGFALRATVFAPEPLEVRVREAARGRVEETVTNSRAGTVKARHRAQLSPEVGGRVLEIPYREGERVAAGDVVLRLDPGIQQAQIALQRRELQAAEAQRRQACVAAERARREAGRLRQLAAEGIVSADLLDQAQTSAEAAEAACRAAQAGVEQARAAVGLGERQAAQTVLRAPFSGVVADVAVEVGEWTTPSPPALPVPPVLDIIDPESLYVSAPMDEVDSARIQPGQPARVTIDSYPGRQFQGRVLRVAPFVLDREEQNRTVEIEVGIDDLPPDVRLLPGTSADVEVILLVRDDVLRIPTPALIEGNKALVAEDGVLAERQLRIGVRNWDWTEVVHGLSSGDQVVVSLDRPEVKVGARVRTIREDAAP